MKSIQSITSVCLMVCLMFISRTAEAQIRSGAFSLNPSIGGYVFEGNQDLETELAYGFGLGYHFDEHWAIENVLNYVATESDITGCDMDTYFYHIDGLYHFMPSEKLVPFIAAGAGLMVFDPENAEREENFALNYGAGLKYFLNDSIALRADVRHVVSFDETHNNLLFTAGISFLFGGVKSVSASDKVPVKTEEVPVKAEEKIVIIASEHSEQKIHEVVKIAAEEPKIIILAFEDINFDFDKSVLTPESQEILKRNIRILKDNPNAKIRIAGYTSASGTAAYNYDLSERRASAVKSYLINEGIISPDRLSTIGYGETNPAMFESAPKELYSEAAKANMRVIFEIIVK